MWNDMQTIAKGPQEWQAGIRVELSDTDKGPRLSIQGVTGTTAQLNRGDADSAGQNIDDIAAIPADQLVNGWTPARLARLVEVWRRWHLNDMQAGCEHQRASDRDYAVSEACAVCGYRYGSAWLYEELPPDVVAFAREISEESAAV